MTPSIYDANALPLYGHIRRQPCLRKRGKAQAGFGSKNAMKILSRILVLLVLLLLVGGAVALATWDMPAPSATREKVIPNDRFR